MDRRRQMLRQCRHERLIAMPCGDHNASTAPDTTITLDTIPTWDAPNRLDGCFGDHWSLGGGRILLKERGHFGGSHEPIRFHALVRPAWKAVHPVWRQEAERIPSFATPALGDPTALE